MVVRALSVAMRIEKLIKYVAYGYLLKWKVPWNLKVPVSTAS
jgi:hypothetical protein